MSGLGPIIPNIMIVWAANEQEKSAPLFFPQVETGNKSRGPNHAVYIGSSHWLHILVFARHARRKSFQTMTSTFKPIFCIS